MKTMKKWLLGAVLLCLLLGIAVAVFGFLLPYYSAGTAIDSSGQLIVTQQPDGQLELSWPREKSADFYRVEILQPAADGAGEPQLLYREFAEDTAGFRLPELPADIPLTLRVSAASQYQTLLQKGTRFSEDALEVTACFAVPQVPVSVTYADANEATFTVEVQLERGLQWQYQLLNEAGDILQEQTLADPILKLQFGEAGTLAIPETGSSYRLLVKACREEAGLQILGAVSEEITIDRDSLLDWMLHPVLTRNTKNTFTLTWNENRGMDYEVQLQDEGTGSWNTVSQIPAGGERIYNSPWLEPEKTYTYRVVSIDQEKDDYAAVSESMTFETKALTTYVTVWPVKDLTAYRDSHWVNVAGTAKGGTAYYALDEENGMFAVRIDGEICYIDSNYCMVNLPEYIGGLCSYNITNSAYSIYAVHEFSIPNVTGVVTAGYEDVYQEDGSFLVPLLYPTAKKLYNAALTAREQGYRLKIYDSFRPYIATREIYDLTEKILYLELPDQTYTGLPRESVTDLPEDNRPGFTYLDFGWVMTGHNYVLNAFLARTGSMHNLGIALDLTLEDLETGEEIAMQTSMHDLSQYSVLSQNNEAADILGDIMHGAGFGGLVSEWWHFQDNNARASLSLPYIQNGIDAECWVKDDNGWKYRSPKGSFYTGQTVNISGTDYLFDENGYVMN